MPSRCAEHSAAWMAWLDYRLPPPPVTLISPGGGSAREIQARQEARFRDWRDTVRRMQDAIDAECAAQCQEDVMGITGRAYLDHGDRMSGWKDPPELVTVVTQWGPGGGPRNVAVRRPDGSITVIPFPRRLRRPA